MGDSGVSSGEVVEKLSEMGFEYSAIMEAVRVVGPSINHAAEYILNGSCGRTEVASSSSLKNKSNVPKKAPLRSFVPPSGRVRQSCISDHFTSSQSKRCRTGALPDTRVSNVEKGDKMNVPAARSGVKTTLNAFTVNCQREMDNVLDWEQKANQLLQKHFGYSGVKSFQKEALAAWVACQDCLVLAATGSGKSLCFQIPALLTGKVVVVISPLISLMHDQCLKLAKHGVSACFLGSGQPDSTVEQKAMRGVYDIIYVCPETVLRLIQPLQGLAETRGIALFAIDEVHCVSKWGHDFRPDYRKLSVLRENFTASKLKCLEHDIPLMALTATATVHVREDIIKSLCMSKETKIVLTSFFRPNLKFAVKHSRTSNPTSYEDFRELIKTYATRKNVVDNQAKFSRTVGDAPVHSFSSISIGISDTDTFNSSDMDAFEHGCTSGDSDEIHSEKAKKLSVEYLEDETDIFQSVDDWDVAVGEFHGHFPCEDHYTSKVVDPPMDSRERLKLCQQPLGKGPTIIYVPTRKETLSISKYLCRFGVKAAAYNAGLLKSHLRKVHKEFQENILEVVVATIAFGMGIDKLNVRRIIHYGWPQSLEAYYQEAGRAGRDGKLAECTLYANLSKVPTLLPSRRNEDQTKQAYKMLSVCFRYGMSTSCCRVKTLVEYFGEDFGDKKCLMCDVCVNGPPETRDVKEEVDILMQIIKAHYNTMERTSLRMVVSKIREQCQNFVTTDLIWWQGLARILESKGYIREGDDKSRVQIKFPEPTSKGIEFLQSKVDEAFHVYPEADMLFPTNISKPYSTFAEWGKGWADPEIRRKRLESRHFNKKLWKERSRRSRSKKNRPNLGTARGRIAAKLSTKNC